MSGFNTSGGVGGGPYVESVSAGPGISITGTAIDPIVNNTGVLSVAAGTGGITVTGTAANPIVNLAGAGMPCASYVVEGAVELATLAETLGGSAVGATGCYLSTVPVNIKVREEVATDALFANFAAGVSVSAGFGTQAVDLQAGRTGAGAIASGTYSSALGRDNTVSGSHGVGIGSGNSVGPGTRTLGIGSSNTVAGAYSNGVGALNTTPAAATRCGAFGYRNTAGTVAPENDAQAFGRSNFATAQSAMAFGIMNNVTTPANIDNTTGIIIGDPQATGTVGINSSAVGIANEASGLRTSAFGFKSIASYTGATAIGDRAIARITETVNLAGGIITRKDDGEPIADAQRVFAGAEVIFMTDDIDLTVVADHTIDIPIGASFYIDEVGIILTDVTGALTTQPTVRFGITGTPAKYLAAVITTLLTADKNRERYETLLEDAGEIALLFGITVGATVATSMSGRAYFKGRLIEDQ